jgi:hypothetical protein
MMIAAPSREGLADEGHPREMAGGTEIQISNMVITFWF